MYKILVIEDDEKLKQQVIDMLIYNGYNAVGLIDYRDAISEVEHVKPDLIIMDINLPYANGYQICRGIRKKYSMPIIITSARNSEADQILGMELGSDDFIVKPFNINVLMMKISAYLRRVYGEYNETSKNTYAGISINETNMKISYNNQTRELTKNEYRLIKKFLDTPDEVITREELLNEIWDDKTFVDDNTLTVNVTRVKKVFEELGLYNIITTRRGVGYIFTLGDLHEIN